MLAANAAYDAPAAFAGINRSHVDDVLPVLGVTKLPARSKSFELQAQALPEIVRQANDSCAQPCHPGSLFGFEDRFFRCAKSSETDATKRCCATVELVHK